MLASTIVLGFVLRLIFVGTNPPSLYWDEASIGYEAYSVSQTGMDMHGNHFLQAIFPAYGDYKAPVYIWLASLSVGLFGPTNLAVRLPSVVAGTLAIIGMYYLANVLFKSKKSGLYASVVFALLPSAVHFSRVGFEANVALTCIIWSLVALIKGFDIPKKYYFALASMLSLIAIYAYFSARIVIPLMVASTWVFSRKNKAVNLGVSIFALIFILGLIPLYRSPYFDAANTLRLSTDNITNNTTDIIKSNNLKAVDRNSLASRLFHHRYVYMGEELIGNMLAHFEPDYLFFTGDPNERHSTGYAGIMLISMAPLFFMGLAFCLKEKPRTWFFIMSLWLFFLVPASVPRTIPHALRSLNSLIPIALVVSYGAFKMDNLLRQGKIKRIVVVVCVVLIGIQYAVYGLLVGTFYAKKSAAAWQDGYPQLGTYVATQYNNYDYINIPPGDRLFLYILFYGQFSPSLTQHQSDVFAPVKIGKMTFKPVVWKDDVQGPSSSLIIGAKNDFPEGVKIKDEIMDSEGQVQFVSVDLQNL